MSQMMNNISCPSCGSVSVMQVGKEKNINRPYSDSHKVTVNEYTCSVCGFAGDFSGDNDAIIEDALTLANREAVSNILDYFSSKGISMAAIERAFEIPQRTLTKWKNGLSSPTATGFALMNVLRTFPWILDVAENNYDPITSRKIFINHAVNELLSYTAVFHGKVIGDAGVVQSGGSTLCYVRFSDKTNQQTCQLGSMEKINSMTNANTTMISAR